MDRGLPIALAAASALALSAPPARAESPARETMEGLEELAAPPARLEVRFDLGGLATLRPDENRADLRVELATRPDFWYGLGVSTIESTTTTLTVTEAGGQSSVMTTTTSNAY